MVPVGLRARTALSTLPSSSVAWQYARRSMLWNMRRPAEDGLEDLFRPRAKLREVPSVDHEVIRGRDHISEAPAKLPSVANEKLVPCPGGIGALSLAQALEPHLGGGMDCDDLHALPEPLPEGLELAGSAEPVDDDSLALQAGDRPLCPDPIAVPFTLRVGEPSDCIVGGADALLRALLTDCVAHPHDGKAPFRRDSEEFLLATARHS